MVFIYFFLQYSSSTRIFLYLEDVNCGSCMPGIQKDLLEMSCECFLLYHQMEDIVSILWNIFHCGSLITLVLNLSSIKMKNKGSRQDNLLKVRSWLNTFSPKYKERKCRDPGSSDVKEIPEYLHEMILMEDQCPCF